MPFQVSPGVNVSEIDLTTVVPAVSTTDGAIAGIFNWGPVRERVLVDSENQLVARFGKPTNDNAETWFTASSFLSYGNKLNVVRAADSSVVSAFANSGAATANLVNSVLNQTDYLNKDGYFDTDIQWIAKYPGSFGNSLRISVCDSANAFNSTVNMTSDANTSGTLSITVGSNTGAVIVTNTASGTLVEANTNALAYAATLAEGDLVFVGNNDVGTQYLKVTAVSSISTNSSSRSFTISFEDPLQLHTNISQSSFSRYWEFFNVVDAAPGTSEYVTQFGNSAAKDEIHAVIVDQGGKFTGSPGTILETFRAMSRATDAKTIDGGTNYYKTIMNEQSKYVWFANDRSGAVSNTAQYVTSSAATSVYNERFNSGAEVNTEANCSVATLAAGYDLFQSAEDVDISLVLTGKSVGGTNGEQIGNYLVDNIAEIRKDCVVFISPAKADVVNALGTEASNIVQFRNSCRDTSYAVLDSGYKYMYDRYNDLYRWIPLNGDIAGLCVRTDTTNDPWWSPAGFNRGQIKNIVKLAYNPRKADRDTLYKSGINPVVTFPGQGTVLFGDKTLQSKPSAFDRINVRRLFIVLEKAISTAAKFTLFEFNDAFTRSQFKNLVTPYLRDVKGRRGITDFLVVCDETNNTGEVIDRNEFVGDIYIKPARSINFIQLNFVAVRSGVQFSEVVGQF
jgi:phage tail sheath protein FI